VTDLAESFIPPTAPAKLDPPSWSCFDPEEVASDFDTPDVPCLLACALAFFLACRFLAASVGISTPRAAVGNK